MIFVKMMIVAVIVMEKSRKNNKNKKGPKAKKALGLFLFLSYMVCTIIELI